jgi:hypothetical protein
MLVNEQADASQAESHILHPGSRAVFRAWDGLRQAQALPRREDLDLRKFRDHIANLFLMERAPGAVGLRWRLAGSAFTEIFRRDLTGRPVLEGWDRFERSIIERFLNGVAEELQPCVLRYRLHTDASQLIGAELLALPVAARAGGIHVFGGLFPFRDAGSLEYKAIARMDLSGARGVWKEHVPGDELVRAVSREASPFRPFQVIPGGRS